LREKIANNASKEELNAALNELRGVMVMLQQDAAADQQQQSPVGASAGRSSSASDDVIDAEIL
jgi:hypothetical protein